MDIFEAIRKIAKSTRAQNTFVAAKELHLKLFYNSCDLSKLQEIYLNYLYFYDIILRDVMLDKIDENILKDNIYEDAYMLWKKKNEFKEQKIAKSNKEPFLRLQPTKKIKFPDNR